MHANRNKGAIKKVEKGMMKAKQMKPGLLIEVNLPV